MKTTVEALEGNKVKVSVEVDEAEFDKAINAAFRKLAAEVRIDGFRPGKAPRRVLEARFGAEVGRSQALQDAVPEYYLEAVREHDVDVIAAPDFEVTSGQDEGPVAFEAVVEVRPTVQVPGYGGLRVTLDRPEATDEEIDEQIDRLRGQFAELQTVEREAADGDIVTIDIAGSQDDEPIPQLTAEDFSYEVGSGGILPEVDDNLRGATAGAELTFTAAYPTPAGADEDDDDEDRPSDLDFVITVKQVQERVLPEADDEFAKDASEFDSIAELRADLADRLAKTKRARAEMDLRERTGEALAALVEDEIPEALINNEVSQRLNDLAMRLQAQGMDLDTWVQMSGRSADDIVAELRETAGDAVRVDLALRAVADAEAIECTDDDLEREYAQVAERLNLKAKDVRRQFERADQVSAVRADIRKRKAFDWLLERVEVVDQDGQPVDRASLSLTAGDDDPSADADEVSDDVEGADDE